MENTFNDNIKHIDPELISKTSVDNWDDEHGKAILLSQWSLAEKVLNKSSIDPFISACGDGHVHCQWYVGSDIYCLQIGVEDLFWDFCDKNGHGFYKLLGSLDDVFVEMIEIGVLYD